MTARYQVVLVMFLSLGLLAGCASKDPYAYEKRDAEQQRYQPNAMTRFVLGMPATDSNAPVTGPLGDVNQDHADHYMQQQTAALKTELRNTGVSVEHKGKEIRLVMPGSITFASDSYALKPSFTPILNAVAKVLAHFDQTQLQIVGYTDNRGRAEYNQQLSVLRAEAVENFLINAGIVGARMQSIGRGEKSPVASNKTEQGRASNRRVELSIKAIE